MSSLDSMFAAFAPASQFPLTPLTDRAMDVLMPRIVPLGPVRVVTNHENSFLTLELGEVDLRATIQTIPKLPRSIIRNNEPIITYYRPSNNT